MVDRKNYDSNCQHCEWVWYDIRRSTHGDYYCKIKTVIVDSKRGLYDLGRCEHDCHPRCPIYLSHQRRLEEEAELEIEREEIVNSVPHSD